MNIRSQQIDKFLASSGWGSAVRSALAGDASFRRYERVADNERRAVLMDAPPPQEDVRPFMQVGRELRASGLAAPDVLAADTENGFLLLEDLGDALYSKVLLKHPASEEELYLAAADVLVRLYRLAPEREYSAFPVYNEALLMREVMLLAEWFLPAMLGQERAAPLAEEYRALWKRLLARIPAYRPVLVQRDYHADNLLWLPEREGVTRVGLLDFQDAVIGAPAYDVVSYLEDARRDVSEQTVQGTLRYYLRETGQDEASFMDSYALLGAQRNCKIVGIFVRLAVRDGKANYLRFLPRMWAHLERDLRHPQLVELKAWLDKHVPQEWRGEINVSAAA